MFDIAQGLKFKADFHSKMSVCRHELGVVVNPRFETQTYLNVSRTACSTCSIGSVQLRWTDVAPLPNLAALNYLWWRHSRTWIWRQTFNRSWRTAQVVV